MQSITTLLLLASIPAIQSITCNDDCYDISLDSVNLDQGNNAQCYTYSVSLSSTIDCNIASSPKILFGIDTNTCYINTNDLSSKITSTTPFAHTIKEDDTNDQIIGIEFDIDTTNIDNEFIICIQGIPSGSETTTGPIQISDSSSQCTFPADITPNFCGICDGEEAKTSCFCSNTPNECAVSARPSGILSCQWDDGNNRCIADTAPECTQPAAERPCICFEVEEFCDAMDAEGGRSDCGWDSLNELCAPDECIDEYDCNCFKLEQDCESTPIIDFPRDCIWSIDEECIEFDGTTTDIPETTPCVDDCGCWDNEIDCEQDHRHLEIPLRCIWVDECIEESIVPTKAPYYMETSTEMPSIDTTHVWQKPTKPCNSKSKSWDKGSNGGNGGNGGKGSNGGNGGKGSKGSNP